MDNGDGKVRVDMVLDLICVHSYIGYTRLARALARWRAEGRTAEIRFAPFELAPGAPTTGAPLLQAIEQTFGAEAARNIGHMAVAATQDGLDLHYERAIATGTFDAHRLVARAARQELAEPMVERLFRAHFTDGLNIGDPATLRELAAKVGVTADDTGTDEEVRLGLEMVRQAGVRSVPVFRFSDGPALSGEQSEEVFLAALRASAGAQEAPEPEDGVTDSKVPEVSAHLRQYLSTGGAVGHDYYGFPTLLLTTTGRRSGKRFRTPLIYGRDGDSYVLVGSNGAKPRHPDWYANLLATPAAEIQVKAEHRQVTARMAGPGERDRLWELMAGIFPQYRKYAEQTDRTIPVVVLDPRAD